MKWVCLRNFTWLRTERFCTKQPAPVLSHLCGYDVGVGRHEGPKQDFQGILLVLPNAGRARESLGGCFGPDRGAKLRVDLEAVHCSIACAFAC